ncbi:hypothetical protein BDV41DRAFT_548650 [Aspergillus transmontanensis]|uniref:Uncharacterized protein n=1 Tax=Aspergillus transmontanensis TaxID=1034304 RepID=A0A5N6VLE6_9EURO|nr:hypothetical protein BDV41DRAFT_548650 [Aspergillus transmontanensis]
MLISTKMPRFSTFQYTASNLFQEKSFFIQSMYVLYSNLCISILFFLARVLQGPLPVVCEPGRCPSGNH